jgi:hypothetical protein
MPQHALLRRRKALRASAAGVCNLMRKQPPVPWPAQCLRSQSKRIYWPAASASAPLYPESPLRSSRCRLTPRSAPTRYGRPACPCGALVYAAPHGQAVLPPRSVLARTLGLTQAPTPAPATQPNAGRCSLRIAPKADRELSLQSSYDTSRSHRPNIL